MSLITELASKAAQAAHILAVLDEVTKDKVLQEMADALPGQSHH